MDDLKTLTRQQLIAKSTLDYTDKSSFEYTGYTKAIYCLLILLSIVSIVLITYTLCSEHRPHPLYAVLIFLCTMLFIDHVRLIRANQRMDALLQLIIMSSP